MTQIRFYNEFLCEYLLNHCIIGRLLEDCKSVLDVSHPPSIIIFATQSNHQHYLLPIMGHYHFGCPHGEVGSFLDCHSSPSILTFCSSA